ncbi:transposase [Halomonas heilongjiangensis]|uniref:Transposase DDE domain-containing protein n=1 Tax=Halomonas heilongjiangensis TaxID=1387883 RepID=A0A2N7TJT5_9GAMM|nr:hypothetical protein C1H66_14450 [Halomonas heilongjiangensis]PXX86615.1 hypothetical protein CR158_22100 [Halomonas heilongjiangensis]
MAIQGEIVEQFIRTFRRPPKKCLILDFDATDDPVHGEQLGRHFSGFYDGYCFLPLYIFCGQQLLVSYLRPAYRDAAHHAGAILALLVRRLRQAWPEVKLVFRGDSGFCRPLILAWCERHGVEYIVGLATKSRLEKLSLDIRYESAIRWEAERGVTPIQWTVHGFSLRLPPEGYRARCKALSSITLSRSLVLLNDFVVVCRPACDARQAATYPVDDI